MRSLSQIVTGNTFLALAFLLASTSTFAIGSRPNPRDFRYNPDNRSNPREYLIAASEYVGSILKEGLADYEDLDQAAKDYQFLEKSGSLVRGAPGFNVDYIAYCPKASRADCDESNPSEFKHVFIIGEANQDELRTSITEQLDHMRRFVRSFGATERAVIIPPSANSNTSFINHVVKFFQTAPKIIHGHNNRTQEASLKEGTYTIVKGRSSERVYAVDSSADFSERADPVLARSATTQNNEVELSEDISDLLVTGSRSVNYDLEDSSISSVQATNNEEESRSVLSRMLTGTFQTFHRGNVGFIFANMEVANRLKMAFNGLKSNALSITISKGATHLVEKKR